MELYHDFFLVKNPGQYRYVGIDPEETVGISPDGQYGKQTVFVYHIVQSAN